MKVIRASHANYRAKYPELSSMWPKNLQLAAIETSGLNCVWYEHIAERLPCH